jgi:hypothetical protein
MKILIKSALRAFLFFFLAIALPMGCPSGTNTNNNPIVIASPPLITPQDAPASRYLSAQSTENLRPLTADKGGYDPDYKLLNPRRIEKIGPNLPSTHPKHIEGLRDNQPQDPAFYDPRKEVRVILAPPVGKEEISSQTLLENMLSHIDNPLSKFETVTLKRINNMREAAIKKNGPGPRVIVAGMGPTGLLTILEAYSAGASIIGVEQRSQYTRPQILRLTPDTINRMAFFAGPKLWNYFIGLGYISNSPNWSFNKYDFNNRFLYPKIYDLKEKIRTTKDQALKQTLVQEKQAEEQKILNQFKPEETAQLQAFKNQGLELESVEIIRINQLETFMAALIEKLAKKDPEHIRLFYGSVISATANAKTFALDLEISSGDSKQKFPLDGDIIIIAEGGGSKLAQVLGLKSKILSDKLYGSTVALRLPHGFDITLRPIENFDGTASVKGIAKIDDEKLTQPGNPLIGAKTNQLYTWTMIKEQDLCKELNQVLGDTAIATNTPIAGILLPCDTKSPALGAPWNKTNGGEKYFLPRTRYFFTGGIAYLGAELNEAQFAMFEKRKDADKTISDAAQLGLKKYLLILAKKHMPREYIEGQGQAHMISPAALNPGNNFAAANNNRVATVTEEKYSLSDFPIELKKADDFFIKTKIKNNNKPEKDVVVVQIGDSYGTTHFFTGSGAVNGLQAARAVGEALNNGNKESDWQKAAQKVSVATDKMHSKVMQGTDNAPLDGPFNSKL